MKPFVGVIVGSAGSGKSTVARQLARHHHAALLDKDSITSDLLSIAMELQGQRGADRESNDFYLHRLMPLEYSALFRACADNLGNDVPVILDAPFAAYLDQPDYLRNAARDHDWPDVPVLVGYVTAPAETVRSRLMARENPRDEWKLSHWAEFWHAVGQKAPRWTGVTTVSIPNDAAPDLTLWQEAARTTIHGSETCSERSDRNEDAR